MNEFGYLNLLAPQMFSPEEEDQTIKNVMTIDFAFGHRQIIDQFSNQHPSFKSHYRLLESFSRKQLTEAVAIAKRSSLLLTMIMLTGVCNANCAICYTERKKKRNELVFNEIKSIIMQAKSLGTKTIYIAGEGEPTLDDAFWQVVDCVKSVGLRILLFTNGILLSNDRLARERWGLTSEQIVLKLADAPVWIYHKFWSTRPELVRAMMCLPRNIDYDYVNYRLECGNCISIPRGVVLLLKYFPRDRVGLEIVVERRNAEEVADTIMPFISETGLKSYVEPIVHSGRYFDNHCYDPSDEQLSFLRPYLVRQNCRRVAYKLVVHNNGVVTPALAMLPSSLRFEGDYGDLDIRSPDGIKNIFVLRHTHPYLVKYRYQIDGCLCERFNTQMAAKLCQQKTTVSQTV